MQLAAHSHGGRSWDWLSRSSWRVAGACGWTLASLTLAAAAAAQTWPGTTWTSASAASVGMDQTRTTTALNYGKARLGSGNLVRAGKLVGSWGVQSTLYDIKAVTKSIGSILIGVAIKDKRITFDTKPNAYVPNFATP